MKKIHISDNAFTVFVIVFGLVACFWPLLFAISAFASLPTANLPLASKRVAVISLILLNIWWFSILYKAVKAGLARREARNNQKANIQ
jgi:hypothetical protein